MRSARASVALALVCAITGTAQAETFAIPPGALGTIVAAIGAQTNTTIVLTDAGLAAQRSSGVSGRYSLKSAIDHALRGTNGKATYYGPTVVRIVPRPPRRVPVARQSPALPPMTAAPPADIVVTASKQNLTLDRYAGSAKLLPLDPAWVDRNAADGTSAITALLPALTSTNLGPGRDKLFIRGIADSSFNGPTQATTGQYLGDVRLTYNAPDPDLNLYDMKQVEILVGPQGTLYGAGSLGGVLRLVPNVPDTNTLAASFSTGLGATAHGGFNRDGAGMLNLPLIDDRVAIRLVVFGRHQSGYIDDSERQLRGVNAGDSFGERFSLRFRNLGGWTVDLGYVSQNITDHDAQYALSNAAPLTRASAIAQPFHNDYRLGYVRAERAIGQADLVSTTSLARHDLTTVYDATGADGTSNPARFTEANDITLFSHETRLSGGSGRSSWVLGATSLFSSSVLSRTLGTSGAEASIPGVVNTQFEAALFGQIAHPLTSTLTGTIGERLTFAHSSGFLIDDAVTDGVRVSRNAVRPSTTLALDWHPGGSWSAFFHYQQGYRPGGLAVTPSGSTQAAERFAGDDLNMNEIGLRLGDDRHDRVTVRAAIFVADWNHIQADLVDEKGLPYTANIGRGRIYGLDGEIAWHLTPTLRLTASAFVNDSDLSDPALGYDTDRPQTLPNVSRGGGRISGSWQRTMQSGMTASLDASVRYVGKSTLGVGSFLDLSQGGYATVDLGSSIGWKQFGLSLEIDNVLDARANTFAFGDPFTLYRQAQITPLRPRTVRIGVNGRF